MANMEPIETTMAAYDKYVPNVYVPEPSVMMALLRAVELHDAHSYLPQLWTDIVRFEQYTRDNIIDLFLAIMAKNDSDDEKLREQFVAIVDDLVARVDTLEGGETMWRPVK